MLQAQYYCLSKPFIIHFSRQERLPVGLHFLPVVFFHFVLVLQPAQAVWNLKTRELNSRTETPYQTIIIINDNTGLSKYSFA